MNDQLCPNYFCKACLYGRCPLASYDDCFECPYYEGCSGCYLSDVCDKS